MMLSPDPELLAPAARDAAYVGSAEHKMAFTWLGPKKLRSDATPCPRDLKDPQEITGWLKEAISAGQVGEYWEGRFPRYVWGQRDGKYFEGRLMNQESGEYKGYPIDLDEMPRQLR